jgi:hypothetical protein
MDKTPQRTPMAFLGKEFDAFLFATVGEDPNGMVLSLASALARQDVDPWREAANLAGLPGEAAIGRLAAFITALPGRPFASSDPGTIATRLVALLPRRAGTALPPLAWAPKADAATRSQTAKNLLFWAVALAIAVSIALVSIRDASGPPAGIDPAPAAASVSPATSLDGRPGDGSRN